MREYELYLVIDADADEETVEALIARLRELVLADGGEAIKIDARGKRRLAYPIKRKMESQDIILTFQTPPQVLAEIERVLKLSEETLRYLLVRTDEK
ncbi:MAG: 30S ribosomal protein S6 [Anaerolineae bacterium]|jgi:small subunit ribosomal protein S6